MMLKNILFCEGGNFAILTALLIPIILLSAGFAVDYSMMTLELKRAQESADAAALAASQAYNKGLSGEQALLSLANSHVAGNLGADIRSAILRSPLRLPPIVPSGLQAG